MAKAAASVRQARSAPKKGGMDRVGRSVGGKLITAIAIAVGAGLAGMVALNTTLQERDIFAENERTMRQVTQSVIHGIETIMLNGYADIAPFYAETLRDIPGIADFRVLRSDGRVAYRDNATIDAVNRRLGEERFVRRQEEPVAQALPADFGYLAQAVRSRRPTFYYDTDTETGERRITLLDPVVLGEACHGCHDPRQPVNAVVKLTTSLSQVEEDIAATRRAALGILAFWLAAIVATAYLVVRRSVIAPIATVSQAMAQVAAGHLDQNVPVFGGDELGKMARCFNVMSERLRTTYDGLQAEQNKLTTIILAAIEGIVVTDDGLNVVLVNPAAERLLGKSTAEIMAQGFAKLLDDPARMRRWLDQGAVTEDVTYNGRILNVEVATIMQDGVLVGCSALLRDVTSERVLEDKLRALSTTDGLTGLGNRRHLDAMLEREVTRAQRYGLDLAVLMFDIDHFKRFNDTYGHDQGDRVLKAVAAQVEATVRQVDIPCRYGGEEFVVLLPATAAEGAAEMAERLRRNVEAMEVDGLKVTITIGVASLRNTGAESAAVLVEAADQALYRGKKEGRNRVVVAAAEV